MSKNDVLCKVFGVRPSDEGAQDIHEAVADIAAAARECAVVLGYNDDADRGVARVLLDMADAAPEFPEGWKSVGDANPAGGMTLLFTGGDIIMASDFIAAVQERASGQELTDDAYLQSHINVLRTLADPANDGLY